MDVLETAKVAFDSVINKGELPPTEVLKLLITQLLGYGILAGACITKLPQIIVILRARSAEGLSAAMFEIETYCLLIGAIYGHVFGLPFNSYGESAILALQNFLLLALVYRYSATPRTRQVGAACAYGTLLWMVAQGRLTRPMAQNLYEANNFINMASRVPQIYKNWQAKSTGQLSLITCAINVLGCIVRLYTTMQSNGGDVMLRNYAVSLVLNAVLVAQILVYAKKARKAPGLARRAARALQQQQEAKKDK